MKIAQGHDDDLDDREHKIVCFWPQEVKFCLPKKRGMLLASFFVNCMEQLNSNEGRAPTPSFLY